MINEIFNERKRHALSRIQSANTDELTTDGFLSRVVNACKPIIPQIDVEGRKSNYEEVSATPGLWSAAGGGMMGQDNVVTVFEFQFPVNHTKTSEYRLMMHGLGQPDNGKYTLSDGTIKFTTVKKGSASQLKNIADEAREAAVLYANGLNNMYKGFEDRFDQFVRNELIPFIHSEINKEIKKRNDDQDIRGRL